LGALFLAASDIGRKDKPGSNVLQTASGIIGSPESPWQTPEVADALDKARRYGEDASKPVKSLEGLLRGAVSATSDTERQRLSDTALRAAVSLNKTYDDKRDSILTHQLSLPLLMDKYEQAAPADRAGMKTLLRGKATREWRKLSTSDTARYRALMRLPAGN
jgi:hypothetical protein